MFGLFLAGLIGTGAHSIYKEAKYQDKVNAAGHWALVNCKTVDEIIFEKCLWRTSSDMPKLTDEELRHIEWLYENHMGVSQTIQSGYREQTGKDLFFVIKERRQ